MKILGKSINKNRNRTGITVCAGRLAFYFKCMLLGTWMAARPGRGKCFANCALS